MPSLTKAQYDEIVYWEMDIFLDNPFKYSIDSPYFCADDALRRSLYLAHITFGPR